ncbi:hypothetical protein [Tardiphaga sp. 285_C5_N1_2]|uniref:hypothetical protein n=1 Tax=Tardiphaga sp. 285_C5_N1_2 TaxID=3240775 RepID=UPI003F8A1214
MIDQQKGGIGRRGFLGRAAAALAVGAGANVAAIATTRPTPAVAAPSEDHKVVDIGRRLNSAIMTYRQAHDRYISARAEAQRLCPAVPEEIVRPNNWQDRRMFAGCAEEETDVEGKRLPLKLEDCDDGLKRSPPPRWLIRADKLEEAINDGQIHAPLRSKLGRHLRKVVIPAARKYDAEREAAIEASGLAASSTAAYWAGHELEKLAYEAVEAQPKTLSGVVIIAQVLGGYAIAEHAPYMHGYPGRSAQIVGVSLARSLMRVTEETSVPRILL